MSKNAGAPGNAGGAPPAPKSDAAMDAIQGKLAGMQLEAGGQPQKPHGNNFFGFAAPTMGLEVNTPGGGGGDGSMAAGGGGAPHGAGVSNGSRLDTSGGSGGGGPGTVDQRRGTGAGGGGRAPGGGDGGGVSVSRRYGVPMASNSRNAGGGNRGVPPVTGGGPGMAYSGDDGRRGPGGGGGRRVGGGGPSAGMKGGVGVAGSRARVGYDPAGASPVRGPVEQSPLQVPHMGFNGNGAMSPSSTGIPQPAQQQQQQQQGMYGASGNGSAPSAGMGQHMGMQGGPVGVGLPHGMGGGSSVHTGSIGGHLGHHMDPSQQALLGQMQSGMYYGAGGYPNGMTAQGTGSPGMSHINQASGAYPSSPGHSVSYGMQSGQQMGGMDMPQGMSSGYPVGAGGMVPNMGVLPGATNMQSPFGAYWQSGEVPGYGGMSNGVSSYGGAYAAVDSGVRDVGSSVPGNKNQGNQYQTAGGAGAQSGQRVGADPYVARQQQAYDTREYAGQPAYSYSSVGGVGSYGVGAYGFGYGVGAASPKMGINRDRRRERRVGGVAGGGYGGPDPQRESELSVATENLTLEEIDGNVFRMSKDQIGCRLLQLKLDQGDPAFVEKICGEAKPYLAEMMKDPFGNYLFQKIADKVDEAGRTELVKKVADEMVDAGMNLHGTRSVQKVIEVCRGTPSQVALVVSALRPATVTLCLDTNGNHVVQRLLQHLAPTDNAFVFEMLAESCVPVATHRHGCCVLQRALDAATVEQARLLIGQVCTHALQLMQDPYGNYVVQYVLGICDRAEADILVNIPLGKVAMLSMQKFSSNVIEKCMDRASEDIIVKYVHELADPAAMRPLLQDQYANYVIQKTLQLAPRDAALSLVESIREHLSLMRNSSGGRRMLTKIAKRFPEINLEDDVPVPGPPVMVPGGVEP